MHRAIVIGLPERVLHLLEQARRHRVVFVGPREGDSGAAVFHLVFDLLVIACVVDSHTVLPRSRPAARPVPFGSGFCRIVFTASQRFPLSRVYQSRPASSRRLDAETEAGAGKSVAVASPNCTAIPGQGQRVGLFEMPCVLERETTEVRPLWAYLPRRKDAIADV